jgi:hypothetical protein
MPSIESEPKFQAYLKERVAEFRKLVNELKPNEKSQGAIFSPDRTRRYLLWRCWKWGGMGSMAFIVGCNPRGADEAKEDAFTRHFTTFCKQCGFGGFFYICLSPIVTADKYRLRDDFLSAGDRWTPAEYELIDMFIPCRSKYLTTGSIRICRGRALGVAQYRQAYLLDRVTRTYGTSGSSSVNSFGRTNNGMSFDIRRLPRNKDGKVDYTNHIRLHYSR